MSKIKIILGFVVLVFMITAIIYLISYLMANSPRNKLNTVDDFPDTEDELVRITRVIDGDTVETETGEVIRLIGIDSPELSGQEDCYAQEAKDRASELMENTKVRLEKDMSETDRYGRSLRYIYIDNIFINKILVREGYAKAVKFKPDIKFSEQLEAAENAAIAANLGLWQACEQPDAE